jgi:hypothetical protein
MPFNVTRTRPRLLDAPSTISLYIDNTRSRMIALASRVVSTRLISLLVAHIPHYGPSAFTHRRNGRILIIRLKVIAAAYRHAAMHYIDDKQQPI